MCGEYLFNSVDIHSSIMSSGINYIFIEDGKNTINKRINQDQDTKSIRCNLCDAKLGGYIIQHSANGVDLFRFQRHLIVRRRVFLFNDKVNWGTGPFVNIPSVFNIDKPVKVESLMHVLTAHSDACFSADHEGCYLEFHK